MRKANDWDAVSLSKAERLKKAGWVAVAVSDNYVKAHQMILGLRSNELVETLISQLSEEVKSIVKTEIAKMATDFHNGISGK